MKFNIFALSSAAAFAVVSCGAPAEPEVPESTTSDAEAAGSSRYTFFEVTRQDFRKCMWPMCGGVYVKRVNVAKTKCADGTWQDECYVADQDLSLLGLSDNQAGDVRNRFVGQQLLLKGSIKAVAHADLSMTVSTLVATEAWDGQGSAERSEYDRFYRMENSGIVCITYPCPTVTEAKLNSSAKEKNIAGLDLSAAGATDEGIDAGYAALNDGNLIARGVHATVTGPAGKGKSLVASNFYTLVEPTAAECTQPDANYIATKDQCMLIKFMCAPDSQPFFDDCGCGCAPSEEPAGEPCGNNTCTDGNVCCNASCGICTPPGGACIQLACGQ